MTEQDQPATSNSQLHETVVAVEPEIITKAITKVASNWARFVTAVFLTEENHPAESTSQRQDTVVAVEPEFIKRIASNWVRYVTENNNNCKHKEFRGFKMVAHSLAAAKRLRKELQNLERSKDEDDDILLVPDSDNILKWAALIRGPKDTPYEGGVFQISIECGTDYPLAPPTMKFVTKVRKQKE